MGLFGKLFGKEEEPIKSNHDFWEWFVENEKRFYKVLKEDGDIEGAFLDKLSPKLDQLRDGFWYLTGMLDNDTAELIFTADGEIKNFVFVEELVMDAPNLDGWKFTALKSASNIDDVYIRMDNLIFSKENLSFYSNDYDKYPDEIDITIVHDDFNTEVSQQIINGTYLFVDNYIGELNSIVNIDSIRIVGREDAEKELVPIEKMKDFLKWRQKEFVEKYDGVKYDTENDNYQGLEATLESGMPLFAIVNSALMNWDGKASHPWMLSISITYEGNENGMPENDVYELMNEFEDSLMTFLKDSEGYLNLGRETYEGKRIIYFACKDFRQPSKILTKAQLEYKDKLDVEYEIYKDKYWQSLNRFRPASN